MTRAFRADNIPLDILMAIGGSDRTWPATALHSNRNRNSPPRARDIDDNR